MTRSNYLTSLSAERDALRKQRREDFLIQQAERLEAERVAEYKFRRDSGLRTVSEIERAKDGGDDWSPIDEEDKFFIGVNGRIVEVPTSTKPTGTEVMNEAGEFLHLGTPTGVFATEAERVWDWARGAVDWNNFAREMIALKRNGRNLTSRQWDALVNCWRKCEAKKAEPARPQVAVDLSAIHRMFDAAIANGHENPKYRAEGLVLSLAKSSSQNAGALYVKLDVGDIYQGKVMNGVFSPSRDIVEGTATALRAIALDPLAAAMRFGQKTGRCSCCGRKLTNKLSVELGIGPICRGEWGL